MATITGDIDSCSCSCLVESHDGFGCSTDECNCDRTPQQIQFLAQIRDSLRLLTPAV